MVTSAMSGRGLSMSTKPMRGMLERTRVELVEPVEHGSFVVDTERHDRADVHVIGLGRAVLGEPSLVLGAGTCDESREGCAVEMAAEPQAHEQRETELLVAG